MAKLIQQMIDSLKAQLEAKYNITIDIHDVRESPYDIKSDPMTERDLGVIDIYIPRADDLNWYKEKRPEYYKNSSQDTLEQARLNSALFIYC